MELRHSLSPLLEMLFRHTKEVSPFMQPVDPVQHGCPVSTSAVWDNHDVPGHRTELVSWLFAVTNDLLVELGELSIGP